jgi:hypothetical protein
MKCFYGAEETWAAWRRGRGVKARGDKLSGA